MENLRRQREAEDKKIVGAMTALWGAYSILSWVLTIFLVQSAGEKVIIVWLAITIGALIVSMVPVLNKTALLILATLKFSLQLVGSLPWIIAIYGLSEVPKHTKKHVRHFVNMQRTRKG